MNSILNNESETAYVCAPQTAIRDVLSRINQTEFLFQVVLDSDRKVLGTVTDGDIRRALLHGGNLDDPVVDWMYVDFKRGFDDDLIAARAILYDKERPVKFIPILDRQGRLVDLVSRARPIDDVGIQRALVMAGGFGSRLGKLTQSKPKPLLEIGGRPILDHVLSALEDAGVPEIVVSVHYLADQIKAFIAERESRSRISCLEEEEPLGTAGALAKLDSSFAEPTLVINGDVITRLDYEALHGFYTKHGVDGLLAVAPYEVNVPFGVIRVGENGRFSGIEEKPTLTEFVSAGVYYLSPEILALVPTGRKTDMPEVLNRARDLGLEIGLFPVHEYWLDVGRVDDLDRAKADHD